jgi:tetratricopeptide (TPR) repeat protein
VEITGLGGRIVSAARSPVSSDLTGEHVKIMTRSAILASLIALAVPLRASAQDSQCHNLKFRSNFRLNGAMQHITQAEASAFADVKRGRASNALSVLNEASQAGGADLPTLWYMFGRVYLIQGDLVGADSAYTKAAALMPTDTLCLREIARQRKNVWIPILNDAVGQMQSQNYDSAIALSRRAGLIYRDDPGGYLNMASAFMALQKEDSAAAMYRLAAHAGTSADRADLRATAAFNAGRLLERNQHFMAAESMYREYAAMKPRDMEARGSLAGVLTRMNRGTEAAAIYDSIMANADSLDSFSLFGVGVALFRQGQVDTLPANAARRQRSLLSSARAFELGLAKNPSHRDALYNLTNTYLAANDTARVLAAAQRLYAADSMNRQVLVLLARAHQMNRHPNDVVAMLLRRDSLPLEVAVIRFDPRDSTASIRGAVQNLQNREHAGFNLSIEFLNGRNEVVSTERVDVPALGPAGNPGSTYDFNIQAAGRGIVAYRYRVS